MSDEIRFDGKVAIVTGAGNGLGRSHALALAARGAKVVVNDLGGARDGSGGSAAPAEQVVQEIVAAGGEAMANGANVAKMDEVKAMTQAAMDRWGRIDILVNNAGILRDKTFAKMDFEDYRLVIEVHLVGTAACTHAVWPIMREQGYGRIVFTASPSGMHGNFGQANYAAAKAGVIGMMNALHLEGAKSDIRVNVLSPSARTRMTEDLGMPEEVLAALTPEAITAGLVYLVSADAPSRTILSAAGGGYAVGHMVETAGAYLPPGQQTPEGVAAHWEKIAAKGDFKYYQDAGGPTAHFLTQAQAHKG